MSEFVFVANYFKTPLWRAIGTELAQRGVAVSYLSLSPSWTRWLRRSYGPPAVVHTVPSMRRLRSARSDGDPLDYWGIPPAELASLDRVMRRHSTDDAEAYLRGLYRHVRGLFEGREGSMVVSEATWAHEMVVASAVRSRGARWIMPHTVRYPRGRVGLFSDPFESSLADVSGRALTVEECKREIDAISQGAKPDYSAVNAGARSANASFRALAQTAISKSAGSVAQRSHDPTIPSLSQYLSDVGSLARWRRHRSSRRHLASMSMDLPDVPFILLTLHRQPEASVDIRGWRFRNQAALAEAVSRRLPRGWTLAVKEHPDALGDRGPDFYRRLDCLDNLYWVHPGVPTTAAIRRSRGVVSVSGTACYEAGLLGHPALLFSSVFFASLESVSTATVETDVEDWILSLSDASAQDEGCQARWLAELSRRTRVATVSDVKTSPGVMRRENVQEIADFLLELVR